MFLSIIYANCSVMVINNIHNFYLTGQFSTLDFFHSLSLFQIIWIQFLIYMILYLSNKSILFLFQSYFFLHHLFLSSPWTLKYINIKSENISSPNKSICYIILFIIVDLVCYHIFYTPVFLTFLFTPQNSSLNYGQLYYNYLIIKGITLLSKQIP